MAMSNWDAFRTLMVNGTSDRWQAALAVRASDTRISGGSIDTEVNEFTVTPRGSPSAR